MYSEVIKYIILVQLVNIFKVVNIFFIMRDHNCIFFVFPCTTVCLIALTHVDFFTSTTQVSTTLLAKGSSLHEEKGIRIFLPVLNINNIYSMF